MKLTELFAKQTSSTDTGDDVCAMLNELGKVGKPRLCQSDGGWHCSVEVNINTAGARFEITSGFGLNSPTAALSECLSRLRKVQQSLHIQTTIESQLQHEWQGLTDEDKREIINETERDDRGYVMALVEAKLKEKNGE